MAQQQRPDAREECPPTAPCKFITLRGVCSAAGPPASPTRQQTPPGGDHVDPPTTASRTRRLPATCRFRPGPALVTGFSCLPLTGTVQSAGSGSRALLRCILSTGPEPHTQ
ncbi:hypothetical protein J1605_005447 [Eschrichtius robustus]|uniref:Uncharacterized protein n=1 Tax=Eschrichtius robustus TaxID=9764 RepID=A0AB34H7D6_ESCRO|nr:hypothetical protein J1605_005447 [Eschrichtius robustus]